MSAAPPVAAPNFDRLASVYRLLELCTFGPLLQSTRTEFLPDLAKVRHALVLGDGDGRFTAALLQANPAVTVHAIDASPAMLAALQRRAGSNVSRIRTTCADARSWQPDQTQYDFIATHFFLDCLSTGEISSLAQRIRAAAAPGAAWVVSDFAEPAGILGRIVARSLVALLYFAFRLLTGLRQRRLPDHHSALALAGFKLRQQHRRLGGILISELWRQ